MPESYEFLDVQKIDFDRENPRIKIALEKYGDQLTPARMQFALHSAADGDRRTSSYAALRDSIRASRRAVAPITVVKSNDDRYLCIDGNTRLAIYRHFLAEGQHGPWHQISAIVLDESADQREIETVRVSAHLVGSRQWPAYEKARYLHYLRNVRLMDYSEMIALCGGNKPEIERQIDAFHDMNEYYRDVVDDTAFQVDRFSGFVELQKGGIKESIFNAGFELTDFGEWIRDGKIYRLEDVRSLPRVLGDDRAMEIFQNGGPRSIEDAIRHIEDNTTNGIQPTKKVTLERASLSQLVDVLTRRIDGMPYSELRTLKARDHNDTLDLLRNLENLAGSLQSLIGDVSE